MLCAGSGPRPALAFPTHAFALAAARDSSHFNDLNP